MGEGSGPPPHPPAQSFLIGRRIRIKGPLLTVPCVHLYQSAPLDLPAGFDRVVRLLLSVRRSCPFGVSALFRSVLAPGGRAAALLAAGIGPGPLCLGIAPRVRTIRLCSAAASLPCKNSTRGKEQHHGNVYEEPSHLLCPQFRQSRPFRLYHRRAGKSIKPRGRVPR